MVILKIKVEITVILVEMTKNSNFSTEKILNLLSQMMTMMKKTIILHNLTIILIKIVNKNNNFLKNKNLHKNNSKNNSNMSQIFSKNKN